MDSPKSHRTEHLFRLTERIAKGSTRRDGDGAPNDLLELRRILQLADSYGLPEMLCMAQASRRERFEVGARTRGGTDGEPAAELLRKGNEMTSEQITNWFTYHAPSSDDLVAYEKLRNSAKDFANAINDLCPESADKTAAVRKVREAVMTANASIACKGK